MTGILPIKLILSWFVARSISVHRPINPHLQAYAGFWRKIVCLWSLCDSLPPEPSSTHSGNCGESSPHVTQISRDHKYINTAQQHYFKLALSPLLKYGTTSKRIAYTHPFREHSRFGICWAAHMCHRTGLPTKRSLLFVVETSNGVLLKSA